MRTLARSPAPRSGGFTMAEIAVTMLIVFVTLIALLEGLNKAKLSAAHSRNLKVATQLALYTLGQVESGLYAEDIDDIQSGFTGSYAEQGYPPEYWYFEVAFGEEMFQEQDEDELDYYDRPFDSFNPDPWEEEEEDSEEEDLPFEKVKVRVHFPEMPSLNFKGHVTMERWIPWEQVYGPDEDAQEQPDQ